MTRLVNNIMLDGKKGVAQKVVYGAFDLIKEKTEKDPGEVFAHAQELVDMGLSIPQVTQVFLHLKKMGLPVEPVYTIDQAVAALKKLRGGAENA